MLKTLKYEEAYNYTRRPRPADEQLRHIYQIQTRHGSSRQPVWSGSDGRPQSVFGRRQPGPGRTGLARALHRPAVAGTHRAGLAEQHRLSVGTAPRRRGRSRSAIRQACLSALLCPCAAGYGEQFRQPPGYADLFVAGSCQLGTRRLRPDAQRQEAGKGTLCPKPGLPAGRAYPAHSRDSKYLLYPADAR